VIARPDATRAEPQGICLDKGYDYPEVYELLDEYGLSPHIRSRGEEQQALAREDGFRARRWVVERTHSWLNRFRGLLIRWSKKPENHRALLQLACGLITWRMARADALPVGSAGGAWAVRHVRARLAWFPPAASSNRA